MAAALYLGLSPLGGLRRGRPVAVIFLLQQITAAPHAVGATQYSESVFGAGLVTSWIS